MKRSAYGLTGWALAFGLITSASAADLAPPLATPLSPAPAVDAGGWSFALSPYFWGAGLSGNVGVFGLPAVHVEPDFRDILKNLDFAAMVMGEARYERFSFFGDILYSKVSVGVNTPRGILADTADLSSETFAGLFGAGYALIENERGTLDIIGGVRVWYASTGLSFEGQRLDGLSGSDSATWVDGIVGLRGRYALSGGFYLTAWGFVGTGGAKIDWDVAAGLGYSFSDRISAVLGYRALGVDFEKDSFVFDIVQQGPILGVSVRF